MDKSANKVRAILMELPEIQRLNLRLMELATFNHFEGPQVVRSLLENKELWQACLMDREAEILINAMGGLESFVAIDLIKLRDMDDMTRVRLGKQVWNVSTLFILSSEKSADQIKLKILAQTWKADEVDWIEDNEARRMLGGYAKTNARLLRVWWD